MSNTFEPGNIAADLQRCWGGEEPVLGNYCGQTFYATRVAPDGRCAFPFPAQSFTALLNVQSPQPEGVLRTAVRSCLDHGMRLAVCTGRGAEALGGIVDELVDEGGYGVDGRTVYASVHDGEPLEEVVEYFMLPQGLAEIGLLLVFGNDEAYGETEDIVRLISNGGAADCECEAETALETVGAAEPVLA